MKNAITWSQACFVVDADQVDPLTTILETFLAQAITTENAGEDEFYEIAFPGKPDWRKVRLTALFDQSIDLNPIIGFVNNHFTGQEIPVTVNQLKDQDWERVWLESFEPIKVGKDLWVCPSWCEPTQPNARNIILDPGLAFGTGTHPTTHLCLDWLSRQDLSDKTVLDYGSGSGILAIAALLSNASQATAVDIDPLAVTASLDNAQRNQVAPRLNACLPNQLEKNTKFDLVIANILADVIIELAPLLVEHMTNNGQILLTGILESQAEQVKNAFNKQLQFIEFQQEQWVLLVAQANARQT